MSDEVPAQIRLAIDPATLCRLLHDRHVVVEDITCLDIPSKHLVRKACLQACSDIFPGQPGQQRKA